MCKASHAGGCVRLGPSSTSSGFAYLPSTFFSIFFSFLREVTRSRKYLTRLLSLPVKPLSAREKTKKCEVSTFYGFANLWRPLALNCALLNMHSKLRNCDYFNC